MNEKAHCSEPGSKSNARGAQNAPDRAPASYRAPVVATYDETLGQGHLDRPGPRGERQPTRWRLRQRSARTRGSRCCSSPWRQRSSR